MAVIPYAAQSWTDGVSSASAARMLVIENGIKEVSLAPAARVYHSANQAITASTDTAVVFNSERFDQVAGGASTQHDTVTNSQRLTCRFAGVYQISAAIAWVNNTNGIRRISLRVNGTTKIAQTTSDSTANDGDAPMAISSLYLLAVNDYVEVIAWHNSSTSPLSVLASGNLSPEFMWVRVG